MPEEAPARAKSWAALCLPDDGCLTAHPSHVGVNMATALELSDAKNGWLGSWCEYEDSAEDNYGNHEQCVEYRVLDELASLALEP